jgi:hypothetical protein
LYTVKTQYGVFHSSYIGYGMKSVSGQSWSWSYGSWICNYICNPWLSPLTLWVRIPLRRGVLDSICNYICNPWLSPLTLWVRIPLRWGVLDSTLCDKDCQWLAAGRCFSPGTPVSPANKAECHEITEILLKVVLSSINQPTNRNSGVWYTELIRLHL